ncbi:MAG: hypothetical protein MH204_02585, partial [Fimbriimonadaceae bacterium]|nr:hypothetical protein [Fimbriimonadaceae bacterium]
MIPALLLAASEPGLVLGWKIEGEALVSAAVVQPLPPDASPAELRSLEAGLGNEGWIWPGLAFRQARLRPGDLLGWQNLTKAPSSPGSSGAGPSDLFDALNRPWTWDDSPVAPRDGTSLWAHARRRDRTTIAAVGPTDQVDFQAIGESAARPRTDGARTPARFRLKPAIPAVLQGWNVILMQGDRPRSPLGPTASADLVAAAALGTGKDSFLFRVLRERLRLSYRPEASLIPTRDGWVWRMSLIRRNGSFADLDLPALLRQEIDAWTEADLTRAQRMAQTALTERVLIDSPLQMQPGRPVRPLPSDYSLWMAWAGSVAGGPVSPLATLEGT